MASNRKNKFTIQSRLILVLVVIIASFLAAFLGQILITSINTRPSLDLSQPFIITDNTTDLDQSKATLDSIEKTERPSLVEIYTADTDLELAAQGVVLTNDGWIVSAISQEQDVLGWEYIRFNSGELLPITNIVEDPVVELVYLQVESSNLTAATLARLDELAIFDTLLLSSFDVISGRSEYLGKTKRQDRTFNSDKQNTFHLISHRYENEAVYNLRGELVGLVVPSELANQSMMIHAISIRSRLDVLLRTDELTAPRIGVTYIDLAHNPILDQPASGAYITSFDRSIASTQLRIDDLIVSANGALLNHELTLSDVISSASIGDTIDIGIIRRGEPETVEITIE